MRPREAGSINREPAFCKGPSICQAGEEQKHCTQRPHNGPGEASSLYLLRTCAEKTRAAVAAGPRVGKTLALT